MNYLIFLVLVLTICSCGESFDSNKQNSNEKINIEKNDTSGFMLKIHSKLKSAEIFQKNAGYEKAESEYNIAIEELNNFINTYPDNSTAYFNRGMAKLGLNNFLDAIQDFDLAIELNPKYVEAIINRASAKQGNFQYNEAIDDYDLAISINSNYSRAFLGKARILARQKEYKDALESYRRFILLDPNEWNAYSGRASIKMELGDFKGAVIDFDKALELIDTGDTSYYNKYFISEIYLNRGNIKLNLNNHNEALSDYSLSIKFLPNQSMAYFNRARARYFLGEKDEACEDWSKAGEFGIMEAYDEIKKYCN